MAYGIVSLPAAALVARLGYPRSIILALGIMIAGCLCIPLATHLDTFAVVLAALFIIASGITILQVAANPLAALLGPAQRSHFRLTLSQAFNSLGTAIAPYLASSVILAGGMFAGGIFFALRLIQSVREQVCLGLNGDWRLHSIHFEKSVLRHRRDGDFFDRVIDLLGQLRETLFRIAELLAVEGVLSRIQFFMEFGIKSIQLVQ